MPPTPPVARDDSAQERAARLLITPGALVQLRLDDAREVVRYMRPMLIDAGTAFIEAGEAKDTDYMLLIIDGDVTVESQSSPDSEGLPSSTVQGDSRPAVSMKSMT